MTTGGFVLAAYATRFQAAWVAPPEDRAPDAEGDPIIVNGPAYTGVLLTGFTVDIAPKVEGKVDAVFFRAGDRVKAGTPLASVDLRRMHEELTSARADLQAAVVGEQDSLLKFKRRVPLGGEAISMEEVDSARAQAGVAHTKVIGQRAKVEQLLGALKDAQLLAPFDGVLVARYLDPGALAGPGRPVFRLLGAGKPQVRFAVPEEQAGELRVGRTLQVTLQSQPPTTLKGTIERVVPEVDSGSRLVFAVGKVELDAAGPRKIASGTVVDVTFIDGEEAPPGGEPTPSAAAPPPAAKAAPREVVRRPFDGVDPELPVL